MIFAELTKRPNYKDVQSILRVLQARFGEIEWGDQGTSESPDAYFIVRREGCTEVQVDNFTSYQFQVKCAQEETPLIQEVMDTLSRSFDIKVLDEPEYEEHE